MSEIILKINDDIRLDEVITLLAPYIETAKIKKTNSKVWIGNADWLNTPVKMESFTPLSREEANAR